MAERAVKREKVDRASAERAAGGGLLAISAAAASVAAAEAAAKASEKVPPFLRQLYEMVCDPTCNDLIRWSDNGKSFLMFEPERLSREQFVNRFRHQNFASFMRQLHNYGFKGRQVSPTSFEYRHPGFVRNQPELLANIRRREKNSKDSGTESKGGAGSGNRTSARGRAAAAASSDGGDSVLMEETVLRSDHDQLRSEHVGLRAQVEELQQHVAHLEGQVERLAEMLVRTVKAVYNPMHAMQLRRGVSDMSTLGKRLRAAMDDSPEGGELGSSYPIGPIGSTPSNMAVLTGGPAAGTSALSAPVALMSTPTQPTTTPSGLPLGPGGMGLPASFFDDVVGASLSHCFLGRSQSQQTRTADDPPWLMQNSSQATIEAVLQALDGVLPTMARPADSQSTAPAAAAAPSAAAAVSAPAPSSNGAGLKVAEAAVRSGLPVVVAGAAPAAAPAATSTPGSASVPAAHAASSASAASQRSAAAAAAAVTRHGSGSAPSSQKST